MTARETALAKLECITAKGAAFTPAEAVAIREMLGGRQVVREVRERGKTAGSTAGKVKR